MGPFCFIRGRSGVALGEHQIQAVAIFLQLEEDVETSFLRTCRRPCLASDPESIEFDGSRTTGQSTDGMFMRRSVNIPLYRCSS
jgi:hypothetical protein